MPPVFLSVEVVDHLLPLKGYYDFVVVFTFAKHFDPAEEYETIYEAEKIE